MNKVIGVFSAFGKAILAVVVMFVSVLIADIAVIASGKDAEVYEGLFMVLYASIMAFLFAIIITRTNISGEERRIRQSRLDLMDVFFLFVFALGMLGLTTIYLIIANAIAKVNPEVNEAVEQYNESMERLAEDTPEVIPNWDHWLYFFSTFLLVPLAEELMFRGVILEAFARIVRPGVAIIVSAGIFGLMHGISVQIGYAVICGLFLGAVYWICDSLIASYLVHAVFNLFGAAFYSLIDSGAIGDISERAQEDFFGAVFMMEMSGILFIIPAFYYLAARRNKLFKPTSKISMMIVGHHDEDATAEGSDSDPDDQERGDRYYE